MNYQIKSIKTSSLTDSEIQKICKLKNTHWNYGFKSNLSWFKKNVKKSDKHNILFYKKKHIIGYTLLRERSFLERKIKKKYFYFDTLIIKKKFRKKNLSRMLMLLNNKVIRMGRKMSFLICLKNQIKFYKKNGWILLPDSKFKVKDHKFSSTFSRSKVNGMVYNYKNKNIKSKINIYFYN